MCSIIEHAEDLTIKIKKIVHAFVYGLTAVVGLGLLGTEASRSHSVTPHSVRLVWTNDQPDASTSS